MRRRPARLRLGLSSGLVLICAGGLLPPLARAQASPRPQTPAAPFPYVVRDVSYINRGDGTPLAGTLTVPKAAGRHPAVILIPGSGGLDRDATMAGHKPFLVVADHLTRHGIAVLRVDSRAPDKYLESTLSDLADDVVAGMAFLKQQPEIDGERIGVVAHSLGSLIAPIVATRSPLVRFVVIMSGIGMTPADLERQQRTERLRARGLSDADIRVRLDAASKMYERLKDGDEDATIDAALARFLKLQLPTEMQVSAEQLEALVKQERATVTSRFYESLETFEPAALWRQVRCPVLAIGGSLDQAVDARRNLDELDKAFREGGNTAATLVELRGLNHLLQRAKTGSPLEIPRIEETMSPAALEMICGWVRARAGVE